MRNVVIVSAVRTPIGRHGGALASVRPDDLAALCIKGALAQAHADPACVDEVILGCANQAGEDNRNVARMALLLAGLPDTTPGLTVNRLCASGLSALNTAARLILTGDAEVVLAGGVESMSRAPWVMPKADRAFPTGNPAVYDTSLGWRFPNPQLEKRFPLEAMGQTAENLAERYHISREAQDQFAFESHQKALAAQAKGAFLAELLPVSLPQKKGEPVVVSEDEGPRKDTQLAKLAKLNPAFREGGTVTAGNASTLNDGAAALLLTTAERARAEGWPVLATWKAAAAAGVDPRVMGIGPVPATEKCLARLGATVADLARIELNEAFAAQALAVIQALSLPSARVNPDGGAIALGHPLGCSGARIVATLIHGLRASGGGLGLATLCVGVGQGEATLLQVD